VEEIERAGGATEDMKHDAGHARGDKTMDEERY
jgi:hypothetical protein